MVVLVRTLSEHRTMDEARAAAKKVKLTKDDLVLTMEKAKDA